MGKKVPFFGKRLHILFAAAGHEQRKSPLEAVRACQETTHSGFALKVRSPE
jgi:hypothetical protein